MSKDTNTGQGNGSSETTPQNQQNQPTLENQEGQQGTGDNQGSPGQEKPETAKPKETPKQKALPKKRKLNTNPNRPLTVDQYLKKASQGQAVADLLRSLYKTKTMSYEVWETETAKLLKKNVW